MEAAFLARQRLQVFWGSLAFSQRSSTACDPPFQKELRAALQLHIQALPEGLKNLVEKLPGEALSPDEEQQIPVWKEDLSTSRRIGKKRQVHEKTNAKFEALC